jgi:ATPase subunit of ABC transporter with duplicated ATPase domains
MGSALLVRDNGSTSVKLYKRKYGNRSEESKEEFPRTELSMAVSHVQAETTLIRTNTRNAPNSDNAFTFRDVSFTVKTPLGDKRLLDKVTGRVHAGELTALMGAVGRPLATLD